MRFPATARLVLMNVVAVVAAGACGGQVLQSVGDPNGPCSDDGDCGTGQRCVEKKCEAADAGNASEQGQATTEYLWVLSGNALLRKGPSDVSMCLGMTLERDPISGLTPCSVIDVAEGRVGCDPTLGLLQPAPEARQSAIATLKERGLCGVTGAQACDSLSFCAVGEAVGADLQSCLSGAPLPIDSRAVWCYVDPDNGIGSSSVAEKCALSDVERRVLRVARLSGADTIVIACAETHSTPASPAAVTGKIGDPFVPSDETKSNFGGYSPGEVSIENGSPSCGSGVGLVYTFSGRVGCPYGQPADTTDLSRVDPTKQTCFTPAGAKVTVPVRAQMVNHRSSNSVYCSCRCDGPDTNAAYCECPGGFECKKLIADYGFGSGRIAGSYCIKSGTAYEPGVLNDQWCDRVSHNCAGP